MEESNEDKRPALYLFTPLSTFVRPYFERLLPDYRITDEPGEAVSAVMISSIDIYDVESGENFNELTPLKQDSEWAAAERTYTETCADHSLQPTILRCAPIVCTGMAGWPREMAEKIYRGTYLGVSGNEARRSVVHAVSLPDAALTALNSGETFNVTDTIDPTIPMLADAFAWRIAQKRIFSLKPKWYRLILGKKKFDAASRSLTFSCEKLRSRGDFNPVSTVDYLKTHVYDENSL
ncbi:MAG: hypothetical protein K2J10_01825 [Muribaculaceae bacterium]|nr:hypothetical protein [Muribaculaceae bacterium]